MFELDNDEIDYGCIDELPLAEHIEWQHWFVEEDEAQVINDLDELELLFF
ncbi:MAG: hypothetical protein Q7U98_18090 [Methylicorpusculum sp.]|nr:hypothetical protein [Methylicorpusculum sp.]MDO8941068.1 hypothetical protein [Methylicorpusculum sp.]MDP2202333.1 hypothetical protein [Methylicorpusculum sp.]